MTDKTDEVRFIGDMTKLKLDHGDMLVLQLDTVVPTEVINRLSDKMADIFGKGHAVVLDKGMKLGAVSMPQYIHSDGNGNITFPVSDHGKA